MKILFFLMLFFSFQISGAQDLKQQVSISFEDAAIPQVLDQLKETTNLHFYYVKEWFGDRRVSGTYEEAPVSQILEDIFNDTYINFYFMEEGGVVLTRNNIIYDELPRGFFPEEQDAVTNRKEEEEVYDPIFYTGNKTPASIPVETIYIGKEDRAGVGSRFTLSGYIYDKDTGNPIPNLAVMVRGRSTGDVTTDAGFYSLELQAGENVLETRSLGSENLHIRVIIYNDGELNLRLSEHFETLGEVYLDSNSEKNVKNAYAGEENIDVREIKNIPLVLGERDIMKVVTTLPGISTAGEGAAGFNVRGGNTDQNLILLDDAVMYNPAHFFGIFSAINPFTTGDVTVYKGSIPAQYGGRLSSVFDLRTKDANTNKVAGEISIGPVTGNVALEIPILKEKSGLLLGVRSTYSDWILENLDDEALAGRSAAFYDANIKYNHKFSESTDLHLTGYYSNDSFSITADSLYRYNNRLGSLRLNHKFSENHRGSIILSNSDYNFNIDYDSDLTNDFSSGYTINETEAKLNMDYRLNPAHRFNYGFSGKLYNVMPGKIEPLGEDSALRPLRLDTEKGLEGAVYFEDSFEVNDRWLLNAGIRYSVFAALGGREQNIYQPGVPKRVSTIVETRVYDDSEVMETYGGPELRLSSRYLLTQDLSVKLSYNNTYQYIHSLSNNTTASPTDTYKLSDINITPQAARQYSLGLYQNLANNTYELSVEGFYKTSANILDYKVGAELFLNEAIETEVLQGEGRAYGAEFLLKKTIGKLNGWLGYTYSRSLIKLDSEYREERVNNGEYFPSNFDKPHDLSMVANYKVTRRFSFSANFVYQTGRPVTVPTGKFYEDGSEYVLYSNRNQYRIPDYYRLDLSFNVEGNHKLQKIAHSFWNISVYNVLGRNNPYSVFFVTEDGEIKAYKSSIFAIPVPTITYNLRF